MDEKDKELLTLQFTRMEEKINAIDLNTQETNKNVKELDRRVRDIEEIVRATDAKDKLINTRLDKLERITSITGFFTEHPNLLAIILIGILILSMNSNLDILLNLFK